MISIIHADDHSLITRTMKQILEAEPDGFRIVASVKSYPELFEALERHAADLLLLDAQIIGGTLTENLPLIRAHYPRLKVLLVWLGVSEHTLLAWIHMLDGQVSLSSSKEDIIIAIREVMKGNRYFTLPVFEKHKNKNE